MPVIRVKSGVSINVFDPNPQNRDPIVFINGWPLNHQMFEYQFSALTDHRCIGIDLRGFGASSAPGEGYSYNDYSDDLAAVVRQMNLRNFILVGFSMGGGVALRYMKRHRGLGVKKVVFMAAAAPCFTKREGFPYGADRETVTGLIMSGLINRPMMLKDFSNIFFTGETQDEEFKAWCTYLSYQASAVGTIQSLYTLRDSDLRDDTRFVNVSAGIFHGKLDRVCPFELGEQLRQMIPGSRLFPFEESGHCIFHDELEKFNREFISFINE